MSAQVSVVVAAYNAEETLRETLESVLAQTLTDWELLVVDDGSTDGVTAEIARAATQGDPRFRLVSVPHRGLVAALETMSGDTSWRPRIKPPWIVSLAGAFGCFAVMFLINPMAGVIALGVELLFQGVAHFPEQLSQDAAVEAPFAAEVIVDQGLVDPGRAGDALHPGSLEALLGKELPSRFEELATGRFAHESSWIV